MLPTLTCDYGYPRAHDPHSFHCCRAILRIELLVLDVDGVLTDGTITYGPDALELKGFHVRDGAGLRFWKDSGRRTAIISGRTSPTVTRRAAELGIDPVIQGSARKVEGLREILKATNLSADRVCAIGDDLPDLPLLRNCGLGFAVADACIEVQQEAHLITTLPGGRGAVREVVEILMQGQGSWEKVLARLRSEQL